MIPTDAQLDAIPLATSSEFEMGTEKELKKARQHIYAINAQGKRTYRTLRKGLLLMVWRFA